MHLTYKPLHPIIITTNTCLASKCTIFKPFLYIGIRIFMLLCLFCSEVLSAPNVLRVGTTENIFVECQDCAQDMTVSIKVLNFPTKTLTLASTSVNLNRGNNYQAFGKLRVNNHCGQTYSTVFCLTHF